MSFQVSNVEMKPIDLTALHERIFAARARARKPRFAEALAKRHSFLPGHCHTNVERLLDSARQYVPVRGWLFYRLSGVQTFCFNAHSLVQRSGGQILIDITPLSDESLRGILGFIESDLDEETFLCIAKEKEPRFCYPPITASAYGMGSGDWGGST
jgi:hypothetical protein